MSQIIIGLSTEGSTDVRLLESILQRTFIAVADECQSQIEVVDPIIKIDKGTGDFVTQMFICSKKAFNQGVMAFCIHSDADDNTNEQVYESKINPLLEHIVIQNQETCSNIVPIIPIRMSEAWMLADKELLKDEIGTTKSNVELGLHRAPESYADPKSAIESAIRISRQDLVKRRRHELKISDLYQTIGRQIDLSKLEQLSSYSHFKERVRDAYRTLNYLH